MPVRWRGGQVLGDLVSSTGIRPQCEYFDCTLLDHNVQREINWELLYECFLSCRRFLLVPPLFSHPCKVSWVRRERWRVVHRAWQVLWRHLVIVQWSRARSFLPWSANWGPHWRLCLWTWGRAHAKLASQFGASRILDRITKAFGFDW